MRKLLPFCIVGMFLLVTTFPVLNAADHHKEEFEQLPLLTDKTDGFIIDQMQTTSSHILILEKSNAFDVAQSFIPERTPLAKVRLFMGKNFEDPATGDLSVYIKQSLTGEVLATGTIEEEDIYTQEVWVNCDFEDISVTIGETYYIIISPEDMSENGQYFWYSSINKDYDWYEQGQAYQNPLGHTNWTELSVIFDAYVDTCFKTYSYSDNIPDLMVEGVLSWDEITPGSVINDTIMVKNVGDTNSLLNWEIQSYPDWGTWTFTPRKGSDVTPGSGGMEILVTVEVPDEQNTDFDGTITFVNQDNPDDIETLSVSLSTPMKNSGRFPMISLLKDLLLERIFSFFLF